MQVPNRLAALVGLRVYTPLGVDSSTSLAEIAASSNQFAETGIPGRRGEPARASRAVIIAADASRTARLTGLATAAIDAHLAAIGGLAAARITALPALLALPEAGRGGAVDVDAVQRVVSERVAAALPGIKLEFPAAAQSRDGRAGFFAVLLTALEILRGARTHAVLVGAVDSLCDADSIRELIGDNRILGASNGDGMIPGEAAGFGLLVSQQLMQSLGLSGVQLGGVSLAQEARHFLQAAPNLGEGLTTALRQLREHPQLGVGRVAKVLSCQTGETAWGEEFSRAYLRNAPLMPEPLTVGVVAESLGDVGAAAAVVQMAVACDQLIAMSAAAAVAGEDGVAPRMLVYGCGDHGQVGACIVAPLPPTRVAGAGGSAPPSAAPPSAAPRQLDETERAFARGSLEYHFEEIGFLLTQRAAYFADPEIPWPAVAGLEERIHARTAAVAAWERGIAVECGLGWLAEPGDDDLVLGVVFVLASLANAVDGEGLWASLLEAMAQAEPAALAVWRQGLRHASGSVVGDALTGCLFADRPDLQQLAATVIGERRQGSAEALHRLLSSTTELDAGVRDAAALALARLAHPKAAACLDALLEVDPGAPALFEAALIAGSATALDRTRQWILNTAEVPAASFVVLGLGGVVDDATLLLQHPAADPQALVARCDALGALGAAAATTWLIGLLGEDDDAVQAAAAAALDRISGAGLRETIAAPPTAAEDAEDLEDPEDADDPDDVAESVARISRDPSAWGEWWAAHAAAFAPGTRYRGGRPFSLSSCVGELAREDAPPELRQMALREIEMRTARALPAAVDAFLGLQLECLVEARARCGPGGK
jgi:3-oxoacyl-[acyl-carrier-protein] synthase-1